MTDNSELEAAILEALKPDTVRAGKPRVIAGRKAFAAYRDRFHALEADNERTNRDRSALCVDFALLTEENARLRAALLPFAQTWAAYQRDYNSDINTSPLYEFIGEELNWFKMWMQHDGYKVAQEADYQQAAAVLADVEASSTSEGDK